MAEHDPARGAVSNGADTFHSNKIITSGFTHCCILRRTRYIRFGENLKNLLDKICHFISIKFDAEHISQMRYI
jgi:hypothetical protein